MKSILVAALLALAATQLHAEEKKRNQGGQTPPTAVPT